jgi:penicillin amidase
MAWCWSISHKSESSLNTIAGLAKIRTAQEFLDHFDNFSGGSYAVMFGNNQGETAFIAPGHFPKRSVSNESGKLIKRGDLKENDWTEWIPRKETPRVINPKKGYMVMTNNKMTTDNHIHDIGTSIGIGPRAERINENIEAKLAKGEKISVKDVFSWQFDTTDIIARRNMPDIEKIYMNIKPYFEEIVSKHAEPEN